MTEGVRAASLGLALALLALATPSLAHDGTHGATVAAGERSAEVKLLDLALVDEQGRTLKFASEAVADHIVVIDFVYTHCTTQCPLLSSVLRQVQADLEPRLAEEVRILSLSIDPARDTPRRLGRFASRFAGPGAEWIWLTGRKPRVDRVLKGLGAFTADFLDHPSLVLVGDPRSGHWIRLYGTPAPEQILAKVAALSAARWNGTAAVTRAPAPEVSKAAQPVADPARQYFTDLPVVTEDGRRHRFYSDLLEGKVVVITLFYSNCEGVCPIVHETLSRVQDSLAERLGRDLFFISITLDPERDTPEVLASYAKRLGTRPGWSFVTGAPPDIRTITGRLGQMGDNIETHLSAFLIGDLRQGAWKKFPASVTAEVLTAFLRRIDPES